MTIDSTTIKNVISNLEIAEGMIEDINASLKSAKSGLYSNIAVDVKDIKINNDCMKELNLARQIHDAFVSILGDEDNSISQDDSMNLDESFDDNDIISSKGNKNGFNADKIATLLGGTSTTFSNEEILSLGKGPLNPELIGKDSEYGQKLQANRKELAMYYSVLISNGFTVEDVRRMIKNAGTVDKLPEEIAKMEQEIVVEACNDNDYSRYDNLIMPSLFGKYYFKRDEYEERKEELEEEISLLENAKEDTIDESTSEKIISESKYDSDTGMYVYKDEKGTQYSFAKEELDKVQENVKENNENKKRNAEERKKELDAKKAELELINAALKDPNRKDFEYTTMDEMNKKIEELENKEKEIRTSTNEYGGEYTKDETRSKLEKKQLNSWFGVNNESIDTSGWTCIKIGKDKYAIMDKNRNYVTASGEKDITAKYTAEELIAAGFYLGDKRYYTKEDLDKINNEITSVHEEAEGLKDIKLQIETQLETEHEYGKYFRLSDETINENCAYNADKNIMYVFNEYGNNGFGDGVFAKQTSKSYMGSVFECILNGGVKDQKSTLGNNTEELWFDVDKLSDESKEELKNKSWLYPYVSLDVVNPNIRDHLDNYINWSTVLNQPEYERTKRVINYICNSSQDGYVKAYDFLMNISEDVDNEYTRQRSIADYQKAQSSPGAVALYEILSLVGKPFEALGTRARMTRKQLSGQKIYGSDTYMASDMYFASALDFVNKNLGYNAREIWKMAYSVDSVLVNMMGTKILGGGPLTSLTMSEFNFGNPKFISAFNDAKKRNVGQEDAFKYATVTSLSHTLATHLSLTHLTGMDASFQAASTNGSVMSTIDKILSKTGLNPNSTLYSAGEKLLLTGYCAINQGVFGASTAATSKALDEFVDIAICGDLSKFDTDYKLYKINNPSASDAEAYLFATTNVFERAANAGLEAIPTALILGGINAPTPTAAKGYGRNPLNPSGEETFNFKAARDLMDKDLPKISPNNGPDTGNSNGNETTSPKLTPILPSEPGGNNEEFVSTKPSPSPSGGNLGRPSGTPSYTSNTTSTGGSTSSIKSVNNNTTSNSSSEDIQVKPMSEIEQADAYLNTLSASDQIKVIDTLLSEGNVDAATYDYLVGKRVEASSSILSPLGTLDSENTNNTTTGYQMSQLQAMATVDGGTQTVTKNIWIPGSSDSTVGSIQQTNPNITNIDAISTETTNTQAPSISTLTDVSIASASPTISNIKVGETTGFPFTPNYTLPAGFPSQRVANAKADTSILSKLNKTKSTISDEIPVIIKEQAQDTTGNDGKSSIKFDRLAPRVESSVTPTITKTSTNPSNETNSLKSLTDIQKEYGYLDRLSASRQIDAINSLLEGRNLDDETRNYLTSKRADAEITASNERHDSLMKASISSDNKVTETTSVVNGVSSNSSELYHVDTMPQSEISARQAAIDKLLSGEKLNIGEKSTDVTITNNSKNNNQSNNLSFFNRVKNKIDNKLGEWIMKDTPEDQGSDVFNILRKKKDTFNILRKNKKNSDDSLLDYINKAVIDSSITKNTDGTYTFDDGWDLIQLSSDTMQKHFDNINSLENDAQENYVKAILSNNLILSNPPSDVSIYSDSNYDFLQHTFGYDISKDEKGYTIKETRVSDEQMLSFINGIDAIEDVNVQNTIINYVKENVTKINHNVFSIMGDKNFIQLYSIFENEVFNDVFAEAISQMSTEQMLSTLVNEKYAAFTDKTIFVTLVSNGINIFDNDFIDNLSTSEIEHLSNIIINNVRQFKSTRFADIIKNGNYNLLRELIELNDVFGPLNKNGLNTFNPTFKFLQSLSLSDNDITKNEIFELECISNYNKEEILLYYLTKNSWCVVDGKYMIISNTDDTVYGCEIDPQMRSIDRIIDFINKNPDLCDDVFKEKHSSIISIYNLINKFDGSQYDEIISLLGDKNYVDLTVDLISELNKKITDEYSTKVMDSYNAINAPSHAQDGVTIYDITTEKFSMLVHSIMSKPATNTEISTQLLNSPNGLSNWGKISGNQNISLSIINNDSIATAGNEKIILGFSDISGFNVFASSGGDEHVSTRNYDLFKNYYLNFARYNHKRFDEITKNKKIDDKQAYNEVAISRYNSNGESIMPTYIVCYDYVRPKDINAAKALGTNGVPLPIYVLHTKDIIENNNANKSKSDASSINTSDVQSSETNADIEIIDASKIDTERENKSGKILKELDNTVGLTEKNLAQIPDNVKNLVISKLVEQGYTTEQSINLLNEKFANFESETELYENVRTIFESDLYNDIIQLLGDGYTLDEIVADGQVSQKKVSRFKAIMDENKLDIDSIIAINKYTIGSNMILAVKRGVEKSKILNNIHSEFNSRLTEYKFPQEQISQIGEYIDSLDYSKPLHENYALVKDFLSKYNISSKYVAAVQSTVRNLNSYYHLDETIINLDNALHQKLSTPMILYRAVDSTYTKNTYGRDLKTLIGQKINTNGYLSTSPLYDSSFAKYDNYDIVYEIYAPAGTEGVLVTPYSCYGKTENEVLLNTASLIITDVVENSVDKNGKVKTVIKAILVNDNVSSLNSNISVIDVSKINTDRENKSILARGVDPNIMNMSYKGYDFVYKTSNDVENAIQQIVSENKNGKILLELDSTIGLTSENLAKLPNNVKIRVLGNYGTENFKGFASNDSGISSLQHATYSISEMQDIMKVINEFESGINPNWNDATKARYAYDYMVNNIRYRDRNQDDQIGGNNNRPSHYDGLTNLIVKKSTCQGFAHTYKELLTRMGIPCVEISGSLGGTGQHAFNVVTIDGENIIVDTTREKFGDYYEDLIYHPERIEFFPTKLKTKEEYQNELRKKKEDYLGTGFGVQNIKEYKFSSNKDLIPTLVSMQQVNLKRAGRELRKLLTTNEFYFKHHVITESSILNGVKTSNTERAQSLQKWAKTDAISLITDFFGKKIDISSIDWDNLILLEESDYKILLDATGNNPMLEGFYDGKHTVIKIPDSIINNHVYETIIHELLHQLSSPEYNAFFDASDKLNHMISGFENMTKKPNKTIWDRPHEGFNEATTDYFAGLIRPDISSSEYTTAYYNAVQNLQKLLSLNIDGFNIDVLKKGYLANDLANIRYAIDKVAGEGFFETKLCPAFNDSIHFEDGFEKLNEVVNKLEKVINTLNNSSKQTFRTLEELSPLLQDEKYFILGHGTGRSSGNVVDSIFENGLRTSHGSITYTTIGLDTSNLTELENKLNNWPHLNSNEIILIRLPIEYINTKGEASDLGGERFGAFYNEHLIDGTDGQRVNYLDPKFIVGVYNTDTHTIRMNENFEEKLSTESINELKSKYNDAVRRTEERLKKQEEAFESIGKKEETITTDTSDIIGDFNIDKLDFNDDDIVWDNNDSASTLTSEESIDNQIFNLLSNDEFVNASFEKQKEMISEISDYDSLSIDTKVTILTALLEKSAGRQGYTLKELGSLSSEKNVSKEIMAEASNQAGELAKKAKSIEPVITEIMKSFENNDCTLIGLESKLKDVNRITEKIISICNKNNISPEKASKEIKDSLRYTLLIDPENYTEKSLEVLRRFKDEGYKIIKAKNTWDSETYKGLNTVIKTQDGIIFEVQFHTSDSFTTKELYTHLYYEIARNDNVMDADKKLAEEVQKIYSKELIIPNGILGLDFLTELGIKTNDDVIDNKNSSNLSVKKESLYTRLTNRFLDWIMSGTPLDQGSDVYYEKVKQQDIIIHDGESTYSIVKNIVNYLNNKYLDDRGLNIIRRYILTKDSSLITRSGNCRKIISSLSIDDIKNAINVIDDHNTSTILDVIEFINGKYSDNSGITRINEYLRTGNINLITRDGNCRDIIRNMSIEDIKVAIKKLNDMNITNVTISSNSSGLSSETYQQLISRVKNQVNNPRAISIIENAVNKALLTDGRVYGNLVRVNSNVEKARPNASEINSYYNRFSNRNKYMINDQENAGAFSHIRTTDFSTKCKVTERLYINNKNCSDTITFVKMFADKCEERGIPFYFKTTYMFNGAENIYPFQLTRDESIVIYSNSKYLSTYVEICNEIKDSTGMKFNSPPILTGVIDEFIGYGKEPSSSGMSYNTLRASLIENSIKEVNNQYARYYNFNPKDSNSVNHFLDNLRNNSKEYNNYLKSIYDTIYRNSRSYGVDPNTFFMNSN